VSESKKAEFERKIESDGHGGCAVDFPLGCISIDHRIWLTEIAVTGLWQGTRTRSLTIKESHRALPQSMLAPATGMFSPTNIKSDQ